MNSIIYYNYDELRKYKFKFILDYNSMFRWYRYYEKLTPKIIGNLLSMNWKCCNTDFLNHIYKTLTPKIVEHLLSLKWGSCNADFLNHIFDNGYISQEELLIYKIS